MKSVWHSCAPWRLALLLSCSAAASALADDRADANWKLRQEHQWREEMQLNLEADRSRYSLLSTAETCLTIPLPNVPRAPTYALTHSDDDEELRFVFWRETCRDGSGTALLVRATPVVGTPFLCSSQFAIIQDGLQRNDIKLESSPDTSWCDDLFVATTLIVNQYELGEVQFDPAAALTIIYDAWLTHVSLDLPDAVLPTPTVIGALRGYRQSSGRCRNVTTGQSVLIRSSNGDRTVNCSVVGLDINAGDRVQFTVTGTVK